MSEAVNPGMGHYAHRSKDVESETLPCHMAIKVKVIWFKV